MSFMHIYLVNFIVYQALHLQSCRNHLKLRMVSFPPRGGHWLPPGAWEHRRLRVPSTPFQGLARIPAVLGSLEELVCMWFLPTPRAQPFGARSLGRGVLPRTCCQSLQPQEQSWAARSLAGRGRLPGPLPILPPASQVFTVFSEASLEEFFTFGPVITILARKGVRATQFSLTRSHPRNV